MYKLYLSCTVKGRKIYSKDYSVLKTYGVEWHRSFDVVTRSDMYSFKKNNDILNGKVIGEVEIYDLHFSLKRICLYDKPKERSEISFSNKHQIVFLTPEELLSITGNYIINAYLPNDNIYSEFGKKLGDMLLMKLNIHR